MRALANKRKNRRLDCYVPVDGKRDSVFGDVQTVDFSRCGLGFVSHKKIPLNKKIPMEIDLGPDEATVLVIGKVIWVKAISGTDLYRIGIHFEEVLRGSKARLKEYFSHKAD